MYFPLMLLLKFIQFADSKADDRIDLDLLLLRTVGLQIRLV